MLAACTLLAGSWTAQAADPIGTLTVERDGLSAQVPDRGYVFKVGNTAKLFQLRGEVLVVFIPPEGGTSGGLYAVPWSTRDAPAWVSNERVVTFGKATPTTTGLLFFERGEILPVFSTGPDAYSVLVQRFGNSAELEIPLATEGVRFEMGAALPAAAAGSATAQAAQPAAAPKPQPPAAPKARLVIEGSGSMITLRTNVEQTVTTPPPVEPPAEAVQPPAAQSEEKAAPAPTEAAPAESASPVRIPSLFEDRKSIIVIGMFAALLIVLFQIQRQLARRRDAPAVHAAAAPVEQTAPLRLRSSRANSTIHPAFPKPASPAAPALAPMPAAAPAPVSTAISTVNGEQPKIKFVSSKKNQTVILGQQNLVGSSNPASAGDTAIIPSPSILPEHRPGGVLFIGKYQVEQLLGRGRMGVVYKAFQQDLNRSVALKLLAEGAHASPQQKERFIKEAQAIAKLRHPNIVTVYEVGEWEGQPYFTMDFVEGKSLDKTIVKQKLPTRESARLTMEIALAVEYAHANGIIHRDLKPGNIILNGKGEPVITDFGLARKLDTQSLHAGDDILGTPSYMSPEQARGRSSETDVRSDVYAVGSILYAMLTGDDPFSGNSLLDTLHKVIHDKPVPPEKMNPEVDAKISAICLKAMSKDPKKRHQTAGELAADLAQYLHLVAAAAAQPPASEQRSTLFGRLFARRA